MKLSRKMERNYEEALRRIPLTRTALKCANTKTGKLLTEMVTEFGIPNDSQSSGITANVLAEDTKCAYVKQEVLETPKEEAPYKG